MCDSQRQTNWILLWRTVYVNNNIAPFRLRPPTHLRKSHLRLLRMSTSLPITSNCVFVDERVNCVDITAAAYKDLPDMWFITFMSCPTTHPRHPFYEDSFSIFTREFEQADDGTHIIEYHHQRPLGS